jgi:hypothetical protein
VTEPFNRRDRLIMVGAEIEGPDGRRMVRLALDTGATCTVIRAPRLQAVGYDPAVPFDRLPVAMGNGVVSLPRLRLERLEALGQSRSGLLVICHTLPPAAGVDGLLGLDFLRDRELKVDFRRGTLTLR